MQLQDGKEQIISLFCFIEVVAAEDPCGSPPSVDNASVTVEVLSLTLVLAHYTCDAGQGYVPRGNNTRPCLISDSFSAWNREIQFSCKSMELLQV